MTVKARWLAYVWLGFACYLRHDAAFAEATDQPLLETESFQTNIIGSVDIRPSWTTRTGEFHLENYFELGAKATRDTLFSYYQALYTNLYRPDEGGDADGMHPTLPYGFLRANFNNLWEDRDGLSFGYEPRVFLPTASTDRDNGMLASVRNYLRFTKKFSPVFSSQFIAMPIFHAFSRAGFVSGGVAQANPEFENRFYVMNVLNLTREITFTLPLMFHATRYQNFRPRAKNNGAWGFYAWTYPEFTYALSPKTTLGLAYYTDNLIRSDFSSTELASGLANGVLQFSVATTL